MGIKDFLETAAQMFLVAVLVMRAVDDVSIP